MADATTPPADAGSSSTSDFLSQLQGKLLNQSGIISSGNTNLEDKINEAIGNVNKSGAASDQATTISYNQKEQAAQLAGDNKVTSTQEAQRGFATNTIALQQLQDNTKKQVNDLEEQKQQAILTGDAATASKVSDIQMQAIQFQQQAQQQVFSNLLGMGTFAQNQQKNELDKQNQDFQEQQAMSTIAAKYGVQVSPGDTIQSITNKVAPYASKDEQQQIALVSSQIQANQAQTQKALSDISDNKPFAPTDLAALGASWNNGGSALIQATVKNAAQLGQIAAEAGKQKIQALTTSIDSGKGTQSKSDAVQAVLAEKSISPDQQAKLLQHIEDTYGPDKSQPGITLAGINKAAGNFWQGAGAGIGNFFTAQQ